MKCMRDISIGYKILIPPGIMLLALACVMLLGINGFDRQARLSRDVHEIALERTTLLQQMSLVSGRVESDLFLAAVLRFMNLPDQEMAQVHDRLEQGLSRMNVLYGEVRHKWPLDPDQQATLEQMKVHLDAFGREARQATDAVSQNPSFGVLLVRSAAAPFDRFRRSLNRFLTLQEARIARAEADSTQTIEKLKTTTLVIAGSAGLLAILATLFIGSRYISRPMLTLTDVMKKLAAGDLSSETGYRTRQDEIGDMAEALEVFRKNAVEKQAAEAALRVSEANYRAIFETANDAIFIQDLSTGQILDVNRKMCDMYGYTAEETRRMDVSVLSEGSPPCSREEAMAWMEKAASGSPQLFEWRARQKNGTVFWVEVNLKRITLQNEDRLLAIVRDISDRKRAEEQVRHLQKAESMGRMAGAIAHHFNNQLQAVTGNLELAISDLPKESAAGLSVKEAMKAALRAAKVSGQMLTYLGQTVGRRETLDPSDVCRLALPMIEAGMSKNVRLKADLPSPGPAIHADANQMEQVLTNLLTNASEALADSGGTIDLTVTTVGATDIPLSHRFPVDWRPEGDAYACLEVRDTGPGIAEGDIEKIFDPFFSTKFTGRGLGLSVALGIVRAHGGCIAVESRCGAGSGKDGGRRSEDGDQGSEVRGQRSGTLGVLASLRENPVGSVFRVFLPLMEGEVSRPKKTPVAAGDVPQGGGTVLLVEDTEQVRNLGVRILQLLGFTVLAAKDGVEGVEIFRERRDEIRFVLSDLTMPRMDGWQTIAALREIDPKIPVILASGYDEASVMSGDHSERPQVFLGKPYSLEELGAAIGKVMEPQMDADQHGFGKKPNGN